MEFRVLGPLEVVDGDRVVSLQRRKQRALLAVLALHPRTPLSADRLIDDLWGESAPANARGALHNNVSQLRTLLGAERIRRDAAGYVFEATREEIDLDRFRRFAADASAARNDAARAAAARSALALWRGPALADLAYEPFAAVTLPQLEAERLALWHDLADAELALGRHATLCDELEALLAEHPYDERLWHRLMLGLYRSARQADSLEAFAAARRRLLELGLEPGPELRQLQRQILEQSSALDLPTAPAAVEPVRKTVTVLFASRPEPDEGIDAEALRADEERFLVRVEEVAGYHGATVERIAGDTAMAVFGLPRAHEDDALRALRAAVALPEASCGVATGDVYADHSARGDLRVTGSAVIAARRLERSATPGTTLLSPATLALVRAAVEVERTTAAYRLLGVVEGASPVERRLDAPLVGRAAELEMLRRAYGDAASTRRYRVVTVLGEAGIGKTRLARELVSEISSRATVLVGRCVSYGEGATYLPLAEMLGDDLESALTGAGSTGEELQALRRHFESLASGRPLVLVFDDIHWAEPTLLDVIEQLGAPILVLCLARPDLLDRRPSWPVTARLGPLDDDETRQLVQVLGGSDDEERVVAIAEGNPLYAEQLLAFAGEVGDLDAVPPTLDALLRDRLDRLEPGARHVLQRAAVVGREFTRDAVANLCAPERAGELAGALAALEDAGLVQEARGRGLRFHHVLIRDAAYASLPKSERAALHERLAASLADRPEELVGRHLEEAVRLRLGVDPSDVHAARLALDAAALLGAAGLRAWKRGDAPAAVNLLGRAAALLPERDPFRLELECELGVALRGTGDLERAEAVLAGAAARADEPRLALRAQLELALARLFSDPGGRADEIVGVAEEAIPVFEAAGDGHALARAWRLIAYVEGSMRCRYARSEEAAERALASERGTGWSTAAILGDLAAALYYGPTPVSRAIRRCRALLERADAGGEANVLPFLAGLEAMRLRFAVARELLDRAEALYAELGQGRFGLVSCAGRRADVEVLAGDAAAAEAALRTKHAAIEAMGDRANLATCAAALAAVVLDAGRDGDADDWSRLADELAPADDVPTQFLSRAVRARLLARRGDVVRAEDLARDAVALSESTDSLSQRADVLLDLADVLRAGGREAAAADSARAALELFEQKGNRAGTARARALLEELAPV